METHKLDAAPRILEGPASDIWHAITGERSFDSIVNELHNAYGLAPEELEKAVESFLRDLFDLGLVTATEPSTEAAGQLRHPDATSHE